MEVSFVDMFDRSCHLLRSTLKEIGNLVVVEMVVTDRLDEVDEEEKDLESKGRVKLIQNHLMMISKLIWHHDHKLLDRNDAI
jgi:hypothetical protein